MSDVKSTIECSCGCTIVRLDYWAPHKYDPDEAIFVEFYTTHGRTHWRHRVKTAWKILTGGNHYLDALVFERPQVQQLHDWTEDVLADRPEA